MLLRTAHHSTPPPSPARSGEAPALAATRPWHEPDILSTETKQFRDAEPPAPARCATRRRRASTARRRPPAGRVRRSVTEASGDAPQLLAPPRGARAAAAQAPARRPRRSGSRMRPATPGARGRAPPRQERGDAARPGAGASRRPAALPGRPAARRAAARAPGARRRPAGGLRRRRRGARRGDARVRRRPARPRPAAAAGAPKRGACPSARRSRTRTTSWCGFPRGPRRGRGGQKARGGAVRGGRGRTRRGTRPQRPRPARRARAARNAAHWPSPTRVAAAAARGDERRWLTQRRDPHAGARPAAPTLAAASGLSPSRSTRRWARRSPRACCATASGLARRRGLPHPAVADAASRLLASRTARSRCHGWIAPSRPFFIWVLCVVLCVCPAAAWR